MEWLLVTARFCGRALIAAGMSVLVLGAALPVTAQETDSRAARAELEKTQADIQRLKDMLDGLKQEVSGLESELKESETDIGRLKGESNELEQQIREGETRLLDLREQAKALQASLEAQQEQIAQQVRAAYMAGQQGYLKVLLNQDDPGRMARMMRYYEYVGQARVEEINRFNDTLSQIQLASADIVREQAALQSAREDLVVRESALQAQQHKRSQLLASLQGQSRSEAQKLAARESERAALNKLIKQLDEAITSLPTPTPPPARSQASSQSQSANQNASQTPAAWPAGGLAFAQARGKMPLPVRGRIVSRYGSQRGGDARLKWDGLLVSASLGTQVHAIHGGRVVFADWLRGSGLLLILDHGNGYLSLYGHNQTLLREVGTWVQPGEAIATVGNSGGLPEPSLYFAIRHRGQALDPLAWCMLSG
ncbi:murein hydrolase activator EnvC [Pseudomonas sp. 5Ae-yellow]|uniref:murein hydrolase activator EnvC family protein n=1 Tax=Pseudomonas sp. 5Ae-yellow TaxID=2759848 RepID=UPI0015F4A261|nr:peptidoglycan DD-metalloendopeptidase family protein [Pseudomonas sp. 5Ae-yellow]MBA6419757.1 peptidoglycan DD-metalloendopeptidase family protein [Pseudomonas sp. 5Ae-yellow]|tara:strand:+ start:176 stop:1450 length:1275 start_codon:yes stop_codon:yes gene_type:complete